MRPKLSMRHARSTGFTLVELGIVLAVSAILAAALVPDFIESARSRMAEKAAQDVAHIHDAAKWFYVESASAATPWLARWPSELDNAGVGAPGTCENLTAGPVVSASSELTTIGYLTVSALTNPWGQAYEVDLGPGMAPPTTRCGLYVSTNLPASVQTVFKSLLPASSCETAAGDPTCPGDPAAGYARCCSRIPKPGGEASIFQAINDMKENWIPNNVYTEVSDPPPLATANYTGTSNSNVYCCESAGQCTVSTGSFSPCGTVCGKIGGGLAMCWSGTCMVNAGTFTSSQSDCDDIAAVGAVGGTYSAGCSLLGPRNYYPATPNFALTLTNSRGEGPAHLYDYQLSAGSGFCRSDSPPSVGATCTFPFVLSLPTPAAGYTCQPADCSDSTKKCP